MNPKISLIPFEEKHLEIYRNWVNDQEIEDLVDRVLPVSEYEHKKWYQDLITNKNAVVFAIESEDGYIGNVWLYNIDWRHRKAEIRILIGAKDCQGKGLGTQAINQIVDFAFKKLNLHRIYAYVLETNNRARKSFIKCEFLIEGTLKNDRFISGKYVNVLIMGLNNE